MFKHIKYKFESLPLCKHPRFLLRILRERFLANLSPPSTAKHAVSLIHRGTERKDGVHTTRHFSSAKAELYIPPMVESAAESFSSQ
jgi:hypothetical protein